MKRHAVAVWEGSGKKGKGHVSTESTVIQHTQYSFASRFESESGTNPEELIAAAHAGCFAMKLSFVLGEAGFEPKKLEAKCAITLEDGAVTNSHLTLKAEVDDIEESKFAECVKEAKENCPISKLLNTNITSEYTLNS